ncbi:MAG: gamma-glutamyltransferase [Pseudomonadota bacterium]
MSISLRFSQQNRALFTAIVIGLFAHVGIAQSASPAQSAIASAHPLATQAGHDILTQGGNAFDAAVAVTAVLAVVEPYSSGIGGGGFYLLEIGRTGRQVMIDAREKAPLAAHRDMYLNESGDVIEGASVDGPLAAGIPGIPAALEHLAEEYGTMPLSLSLKPAIDLARNGFAVDAIYRRLAEFRLEAMRASPATSAALLVNGEVPEEGHMLKQLDLSYTLDAMVKEGAKGFYEGVMAQKLVDGVAAGGGIWTLDDLKSYEIVERDPIKTEYHGMEVVSVAPPSSGGVAIGEILSILAGYGDLTKMDATTRTHLVVEAMRRAYRDRAQYLGDTDFVEVPIERLIHPIYGEGLRATIHPERATPSDLLPGVVAETAGDDTTHFSILDKQGNRVSATLSVNYPFGSGYMAPGTGVILNNEMDDFSAKPGVPNLYGLVGSGANAIEPGKRMLSSMSPSFLEKDGRVAIVGTPGGSRIITMVLLAALDFHAGGDADSMVSLPRFHHQYLPDKIFYEREAMNAEMVADLEARGHTLEEASRTWGNMHAIVWNTRQNVVEAASDPRGIGLAKVKK